MKPSEIELTDRDRAECDRIVLEIRPTSEAAIFETANEIMRTERARVVTLIDKSRGWLVHDDAFQAGGRVALAQLLMNVLAGTQEESK